MRAWQDLEGRLAQYYEIEAPTRAPEWLLERTLDVIDTTPQRRTVLGLPWRIPTMPSTLAKLATTGVALAAIGLIALSLRGPVIGPGASPTPTPVPQATTASPSAFAERFDSPLHALSIGFPAGWQTRVATAPWGHGAITFDAPDVDVVFHPTLRGNLYLALASEPLRETPADEWCCAELISASEVCKAADGANGGAYSLDGADGWIQSCGNESFASHAAFVADATRGYVIVLHVGDVPDREVYDATWFEAALATVDLRRDAAP